MPGRQERRSSSSQTVRGYSGSPPRRGPRLSPGPGILTPEGIGATGHSPARGWIERHGNLAVGTGALLGVLGLFQALRFAVRFQLNDFRLYFAAAQVGLRDGYSALYDPHLERAAVAALTPAGEWFPYLNPPPLALLVTPLTTLPYPVADAIWFLLALAAVATAGALAAPSDWRRRVVYVGLGLSLFPTAWAIGAGQIVPFLMLAVVVAWRLLRADRDVLAGVVLATTVVKPQLVLLVPLCLLANGKGRAFLAYSAVAGMLALLSLGVLGEHGLAQYREALTAASGFHEQIRWGLSKFLGVMAIPATLAVAGLALAASYRSRAKSVEVPFVAGIVASMLIAPYLNDADFAILAVAGWLWLRAGASVGRGWLIILGFFGAQFSQAVEPPILATEAAVLFALLLLPPVRSAPPADARA